MVVWCRPRARHELRARTLALTLTVAFRPPLHPGTASSPRAQLRLRAGLRKPQHSPQAVREMTELEKVREKMANKMKERLRQLEQKEVDDSWDDGEASSEPAPAQLQEGAPIYDAPPDKEPGLLFI